jgi:hypothetical protein
MSVEHIRINGKDVYVFEDHTSALDAWAEVRRTLSHAPYLLTLDHHTDIVPAFTYHYCATHPHMNDEALEQFSVDLKRRIKFNDPESVQKAIKLLKHDEHINAAVGSDILHYAFVICFDQVSGTQPIEIANYYKELSKWWYDNIIGVETPEPEMPSPPYTYAPPEDKIFVVGSGCAVGCNKIPHDDDCVRPHYDQAIEATYLSEKLTTIHEMSHAIGVDQILEQIYVLDIDLDYFHSMKSLNPADPSTFCQIVQRAEAITIATEPRFVRSLALPSEDLDSTIVLSALLQHIDLATGQVIRCS